MGTIVAPAPLVSEVFAALPPSPASGKFIQLATSGDTYIYQNGVWVGVGGSTYLIPYSGNVTEASTVVIENNVASLANAIGYSRCDGVCIGLFDGYAIIRTAGVATCFHNLIMGRNYYLDIIEGEITHTPNGGSTVLIGSAIGNRDLLLKLGVSIKYG